MFDGWFRSEGMMNAVKHMLKINTDLSGKKSSSIAEIAVFAEGESMYRVRKSSNVATVCLSDIRRTLAECGAPYDLYSISDLTLESIDNYKLYIFVNQYDISQKNKKLISEKCKTEGKSILWLYGADYANGGKLSADNITKITGIKVDESNTSHGGVVFGGRTTEYRLASPYFEVNDADASTLTLYEDEKVSSAYKENGSFKSFYIATCNLPSALLRHIAELSGVFVYSSSGNVYIYPNSASFGVYNASMTTAVINMKQDGIYKDLISGETYTCQSGKLVLPYKEINAFLLIKTEEE